MRKSNSLNLVRGKKLYNYVTRGAIFGGCDKILWLKIYMVTRMRIYENVQVISLRRTITSVKERLCSIVLKLLRGKLMEIAINGNFMSRQITGIERYARELTSYFNDLLKENDDVTLLISPTAKNVPEYKNIKVQQIGASKCNSKRNGNGNGIIWEQTALRRYLKEHKNSICLNLCNVAPLFVQPGVTVIHDIMCRVNPEDYKTLRNHMSRYWHMFQYWYITRHEKAIITVSNFSKKEIEKYYPKAKGKIEVIPDAWQHVLKYKKTENWQNKYPFLEDKQFFFSMSTLSKNKNGKWIIEVAKRNPDCVFAMAGKHYETEYKVFPKNVHMLGYITDEDACALIKHCRAFIFPSLYEGFGLPPLEALALGAEVISSNTTSLPEILGDAVHYVDPLDYNIDIDRLSPIKTSDKEKTLEKYNWIESAKELYTLLGVLA